MRFSAALRIPKRGVWGIRVGSDRTVQKCPVLLISLQTANCVEGRLPSFFQDKKKVIPES